jgi:hypothetical protein
VSSSIVAGSDDLLFREIAWYGFRTAAAVLETDEEDADPSGAAIEVLAEFGITDESDPRWNEAVDQFVSGFEYVMSGGADDLD